jgi:acylphosphatase
MKINKLITIEGRVQHVGFRYSACQAASRFRISGIVSNTYDGNVYIEAEGEEDDVISFIGWCRQGPPLAKVLDVKIQDSMLMNYSGFSIR